MSKLTAKRIWALGKILLFGALFLILLAIALNTILSLFFDFSGPSVRFNTGPSLLGILIALAVAEFLLRKFAPRYYFRYGIPILRREYSLFAVKDKITRLESLP